MDIDHDTLVWLSKSVGLFYLIGMAVAVLIYTYWPSPRQKQFEAAAKDILSAEDKPWR